MIKSFRHKGLKRLFKANDATRVQPEHVVRLRQILHALNKATGPRDIGGPTGWRLHRYPNTPVWSIDVSGAWRILFKFDEQDVKEVDYGNFH